MLIREYLTQKSVRFNNQKELVSSCVIETGVNRKTILNTISEMRRSGVILAYSKQLSPEASKTTNTIPTYSSTMKVGISEEELRSRHDVTFIIRQAVKKLQEGFYLLDSEFIKQCNLRSNSGYRSVLGHPDFQNYRGRVGGNIYWSHPKSIKKLKDEGVLQ